MLFPVTHTVGRQAASEQAQSRLQGCLRHTDSWNFTYCAQKAFTVFLSCAFKINSCKTVLNEYVCITQYNYLTYNNAYMVVRFSLIALQELKDKRLLLVECQAKNATYHENTSAPIIKTNIVQREAKAFIACRALSEI